MSQGDIGLDKESAELLLKSVKGYAIYLLDPGGHVTSWNPGAEAIKGYAPKEILGKHFSMFYTPEDLAAGEPERELLAATSGMFEAEGWRLRKNGERFWASVTVTPLFEEGGRLRGFAKVTRDMTEQRRGHEQRIRLERAEEALRLRDEFLGEVKRNMNSILTTIRIHVQSLKASIDTLTGEPPSGVRAKLTTLEWGLDRMSKSIDEVLRTASKTAERLSEQLRAQS
jgi:PAS domain S-box-containing protein